jgi:antirestriction protein ArdC
VIRADHAAYVASWIKVLKDNNRAIFTVASHAQRA